MQDKKVSEAVVRRLPRYYRHLIALEKEGVERISSSALAEQMRLNASQVRQDFNCFGGFGQQGYGYNVKTLLGEIKRILGCTKQRTAVVIGAGNIGQALAHFEGFLRDGITILALFDINDELIGGTIADKPVLHIDRLEEFIKENNVDLGIIAARRSIAQTMAERMAAANIKGIWNFAPEDVVADVPVENVNMSDSMLCLLFRMEENENA